MGGLIRFEFFVIGGSSGRLSICHRESSRDACTRLDGCVRTFLSFRFCEVIRTSGNSPMI